MNIIVWGLGHVGTVTAVTLAIGGHNVLGIEPDSTKREAFKKGMAPVREPGLDDLLVKAMAGGCFAVHGDASPEAIGKAEASLVCVNTPVKDGVCDLSSLIQVAAKIGEGLSATAYHVIVVRSTVPPGTSDGVLRETLEKHSGLQSNIHFGIVHQPEFLREGSAIEDTYRSRYWIVGGEEHRSIEMVESLYAQCGFGPFHRVTLTGSEILKLACNAFHALKITFANEIGSLCEAHQVDGRAVMETLCADSRLNVSKVYLKPGFAFGGPCLEKDLQMLCQAGAETQSHHTLLSSISKSNQEQILGVVERVRRLGAIRVGVIGLAFKCEAADLRGSPSMILVERLRAEGFDVFTYDAHLPVNSKTLKQICGEVDCVIITNRHAEYAAVRECWTGSADALIDFGI